MSIGCCDYEEMPGGDHDGRYRRVLWVCLVLNAAMFLFQTAAGYEALSVALLADALDFMSDAANYGISLFVLRKSLKMRARASLLKGVSIGLVGLWVAYETLGHAFAPQLPATFIMAFASLLGLAVNIGCAVLLYKYRGGDSNRQSVWLCSRNDAIGNFAVLLAAGGVAMTGTLWPDIAVAVIMASLAVSAAVRIVTRALKELA